MKDIRKALGFAGAAFVLAVTASAVGIVINEEFTRRAEAQLSGLPIVPLGYQQITTISASTALTVPTGATSAVITPEAQAVRYRDDGTAPSATVGMPIAVGVTLTYTGTLSAIRFFEQAGGAKLNVSYYR